MPCGATIFSCGTSVSSQALPPALCSAQKSRPSGERTASTTRPRHASAVRCRVERGRAAGGGRRGRGASSRRARCHLERDADADVQAELVHVLRRRRGRRAAARRGCGSAGRRRSRTTGCMSFQRSAALPASTNTAPSSAGRRSISGCSSSTLPVSSTRPPTTAPLTVGPERAIAVAAHGVVAAGAKEHGVGHARSGCARTPRRPRRGRSRTSRRRAGTS